MNCGYARKAFIIVMLAACALAGACAAPHGDANVGSRGDGLHVGGSLGLSFGDGGSGGGGGGPGGGPGGQ